MTRVTEGYRIFTNPFKFECREEDAFRTLCELNFFIKVGVKILPYIYLNHFASKIILSKILTNLRKKYVLASAEKIFIGWQINCQRR